MNGAGLAIKVAALEVIVADLKRMVEGMEPPEEASDE